MTYKEQQDFKIHALICTYNDLATLPLALDSVRDVCDSVIVADGAYKKYYEHFTKFNEAVKPWSTDGTLEILDIYRKRLPITLIPAPNGKPWRNQTEKRSAMLKAVPDKDWFVIVDSDEMLYGNVVQGVNDIMDSGCIAGFAPLYNVGCDVSGFMPFWHSRVFLKLPGMHYERKHWLLCDYANRVIEETYPVWGTNRFVLAHFKVFRHMRRLAPHQSYMLDMGKRGWQEPDTPAIMSESDYEDPEEAEVNML